MRASMLGGVLSVVLVSATMADPAGAAARKMTNIPAESLTQALKTLAKERQFQVLYRAETVRDRRTAGAVGEFTAQEALTRLLSGTGLTYQYLDERTVTIVPLVPATAPETGSDEATDTTKETGKTSSQDFQLAQATVGSGTGTASVDQQNQSSSTAAPALEEVLVTAQKRSENVQDVPSSISVFSDEKLQQLHATSLTDYAAYIPGLNVAGGGSPGQIAITLRGIAPLGPGAVVGSYVDETPVGSSGDFAHAAFFGLDLMPYDISQLEVLRGPQGTLYGAGSMGGLLKYSLRSPSLTDYEVHLGVDTSNVAGAGNLGWGARAALNAPLVTDQLALWLSYYDQHTPGYIDNATTGALDDNAVRQHGGRAVLLWRPQEDISLKIAAMWQRINSDNDSSTALQLTGLNPPTGVPKWGSLSDINSLSQPFANSIDLYSATLDIKFDWASFTSATSYSKTHTVDVSDNSLTIGPLYPLLTGGAVPPGLTGLTTDRALQKETQEFRLTSPSGGKVEWLLGAFFTHERSTNVQDMLAYDDNRQLIPAFAPVLSFAQLPSTYREFAGFGSATYKFTDQFDIGGGLRWARNNQSFSEITGGPVYGDFDAPGTSSESVLTYSVNPRWHLSQGTMVYARVATGYQPGGPNATVHGVISPTAVKADTLTNYELGIKSQFLDNRGLLDFSVFRIDWKDIQTFQTFNGINGLTNAGDAISQGFELETAFSPIHGLRLGLTAAYTEAKLTASPADLGDEVGATLPGIPRWSGAVTADYDMTLNSQWRAHVGGGLRYVDREQSAVVTVVENLSYVLPSYSIVDLSADVTHGPVTIRLFAKNVTDRRAYTGAGTTTDAFNTPLVIETTVLQPRTVGVGLDVRF